MAFPRDLSTHYPPRPQLGLGLAQPQSPLSPNAEPADCGVKIPCVLGEGPRIGSKDTNFKAKLTGRGGRAGRPKAAPASAVEFPAPACAGPAAAAASALLFAM